VVFCKQRFPQLFTVIFAEVTLLCLSICFSSSLHFSCPT